MTSRLDAPVASVVGDRPSLASVRRVLLVRLRSIGDTVLMTPCITALKAWRPDVDVDVLLEPFCAPLLESHPLVSRVVIADRAPASRLRAAGDLRRRGYDIAFDLSGGSTGARWRVGFQGYRFAGLRNARVTSSHDVWRRTDVHTVEHQLALVAGVGVPVSGAGPTTLRASDRGAAAARAALDAWGIGGGPFAVLHPEASLPVKTWPGERFARLADRLRAERGLASVVVGQDEAMVSGAAGSGSARAVRFPLETTMALVAGCSLFVGNDSGPAHVAAAFGRPSVVVFGPSNVDLWRPWSDGPWRVVRGGTTAAGASEEDVVAAVAAVLSEAAISKGS
jgi:ADP-heptose:LPS heptosyltransferase